MFHRVRKNARNRFVSGIFLLMPFGVTLLVMRWLFKWIVGVLRPVVGAALDGLSSIPWVAKIPPEYVGAFVSMVTIIVLLLFVYSIGAVGQFVVGRRLLAATEFVVGRIPLARSIYAATKQVIVSISRPDQQAFKSVVLVEFPRPGYLAIGFLTGTIHDAQGRKCCKVLIPTTPNPTTGFLEVVPADEVVESRMTVEEAFRMIISGGIVSPDVLLPADKPGREMRRNSSDTDV